MLISILCILLTIFLFLDTERLSPFDMLNMVIHINDQMTILSFNNLVGIQSYGHADDSYDHLLEEFVIY
jgi:hypothetical protein